MISLTFDNELGQGDLFVAAGIQQGNELETAIAISLLTWRRASPDDEAPDKSNLAGFWGDTYPDVARDLIGSRLWLLSGKKINDENLALAVDLMNEALKWLLDDGVAESVEPTASRGDDDQLQVGVWVKRPTDLAPRYVAVWEGEIGT